MHFTQPVLMKVYLFGKILTFLDIIDLTIGQPLNGQSLASFHVYFRLFYKQTYNLYNKSMQKIPFSIWCWDSNPRSSEYESLPITTRPGLWPIEKKCCHTHIMPNTYLDGRKHLNVSLGMWPRAVYDWNLGKWWRLFTVTPHRDWMLSRVIACLYRCWTVFCLDGRKTYKWSSSNIILDVNQRSAIMIDSSKLWFLIQLDFVI